MKKVRKVKFPATLTIMEDPDREYYGGEQHRYKVLHKDFDPTPDRPRLQATYKLVGVHEISSTLLVSRKPVKQR